MRYRKLGHSELEVSELSLGSWLTYAGGIEAEQVKASVHQALDVGINFFDTANICRSYFTAGTLKACRVALVEPVAYLRCLAKDRSYKGELRSCTILNKGCQRRQNLKERA
ncbi:aldo/keto reductase [Phormidium tenue FACHB-886]|nr:aldo/keto reductase [Phormidium tenue FACHB-886]